MKPKIKTTVQIATEYRDLGKETFIFEKWISVESEIEFLVAMLKYVDVYDAKEVVCEGLIKKRIKELKGE